MGKRIWMTLGALPVVLAISGCDTSTLPIVGKKLSEADSKAIGAACRHAGRALEDCFTLNPEARQAGVFEGWRDMNDYMVSNKIETITPQVAVKKPDDHEHDSSSDKPDPQANNTQPEKADKNDAPVAKDSKALKGGKDVADRSNPEKPWQRSKKDQS